MARRAMRWFNADKVQPRETDYYVVCYQALEEDFERQAYAIFREGCWIFDRTFFYGIKVTHWGYMPAGSDYPSRDIDWQAAYGGQIEETGDYLVQVIVPSNEPGVDWLITVYVYYESPNDYVTCSLTDKQYPLSKILNWAYDGNDI